MSVDGMNLDTPALDWPTDDYAFSPDRHINALGNRLARQIGPRGADEIATLAMLAVTPRGWTEGLLGLAATARDEGRPFDADCYDRAAESLMEPAAS
jgi:hypothetical protein